jgi:hypothetical protein
LPSWDLPVQCHHCQSSDIAPAQPQFFCWPR